LLKIADNENMEKIYSPPSIFDEQKAHGFKKKIPKEANVEIVYWINN